MICKKGLLPTPSKVGGIARAPVWGANLYYYYYLFYIGSSTVQLHKYEEADGTKKLKKLINKQCIIYISVNVHKSV